MEYCVRCMRRMRWNDRYFAALGPAQSFLGSTATECVCVWATDHSFLILSNSFGVWRDKRHTSTLTAGVAGNQNESHWVMSEDSASTHSILLILRRSTFSLRRASHTRRPKHENISYYEIVWLMLHRREAFNGRFMCASRQAAFSVCRPTYIFHMYLTSHNFHCDDREKNNGKNVRKIIYKRVYIYTNRPNGDQRQIYRHTLLFRFHISWFVIIVIFLSLWMMGEWYF